MNGVHQTQREHLVFGHVPAAALLLVLDLEVLADSATLFVGQRYQQLDAL
jgi:hypothetical protein